MLSVIWCDQPSENWSEYGCRMRGDAMCELSGSAPPGLYRFRVTGQADKGSGVAPYEAISRSFALQKTPPLTFDAPVVGTLARSIGTIRVDRGNQFRQRHVAGCRDILQPGPERVLEAHAGLVPGDDDRALHDGRFHCASPVSILCASRNRRVCSERVASDALSAFERP